MTDSNYTHLLVIADRSGSMKIDNLHVEMENALNALFKEQAAVQGKCLVDYAQFDTVHETVFEDTEVAEAKAVIEPRGLTALLDAVGLAVTNLGKKLANKSEGQRPGLVQVIVVTDGGENASSEWEAAAVKKLISEQESKYGWDFVFLGASLEDVNAAHDYGFAQTKSAVYDKNNPLAAGNITSGYVTRSRLATASGNTEAVYANAFTAEERATANGE